MSVSRSAGIAFGTLAALVWAGQASVSAYGVRGDLSTFDIAALRVGTSGVLILVVFANRIWRTALRLGALRCVALALGAGVPYSLLSIGGLQFSTIPHSAAILSGCVPPIAAGLAWLVLRQQISAGVMFAIGLIVIGVILIVQPFGQAPPPSHWIGDSMFLTGAVLFASFGVLSRRWKVSAIDSTGIAVMVSLFYLPFFFLVAPQEWMGASAFDVLLQAVYQGILAAVIAVYAFLRATEALGPERSAMFVALVPGLTVIVGALAMQEFPGTVAVAGLILLSVGLLLCLRGWDPAGALTIGRRTKYTRPR